MLALTSVGESWYFVRSMAERGWEVERRVYSWDQKGVGVGGSGRVERKGWGVDMLGRAAFIRSSIWSCWSSVRGGS